MEPLPTVLGRDIFAEPPAALVEQFQNDKEIRFENLVEEARLNPFQHDVFLRNHSVVLKKVLPFSVYSQSRNHFRFYAALSPSAKKQAESVQGLPYAEMSIEERKAFEQITDLGLPQPFTSIMQKGLVGFRLVVVRRESGLASTVTLSAHSPSGLFTSYVVRLPGKGRSTLLTR